MFDVEKYWVATADVSRSFHGKSVNEGISGSFRQSVTRIIETFESYRKTYYERVISSSFFLLCKQQNIYVGIQKLLIGHNNILVLTKL